MVEVSISAGEKTEVIGKILAEYRIVEELGGQAGSQVYKAIGFDSRRQVAIKLFSSELSRDKTRLQALLDSLRKISRLNQPGIPRLIGSGLNGGRAYIILPFMTGGSLQERLEIGQISPADALVLLDKIAGVLEKTHGLGVAHGHLSPAEVMFDDTGQLQIIGLGQTHFLLDGSDATSMMGGREHVAPEVRNGGQPTPASDQYSMAVLAFELLAGQRVHEALEAATLGKPNRGVPSSARINLGPRVIEVLQRALEDDPSRRYAGVSEMMRALHEAMHFDGSTSSAPSSSRATRHVTLRIGRSLSWGAVGLAVVTLGCIAVTVPALAAARWMRVDLGSIADLFTDLQSAPTGAPAPGQPRINLPDLSPSMSAPTSAERPRAFLVTPARIGPTEIVSPVDDGGGNDPASTELSAADEEAIDQQGEDAPQPESASSSADQPTATPTPSVWQTANPTDPQQASPTSVPPQPMGTISNGCSDPAGPGCTETLPPH